MNSLRLKYRALRRHGCDPFTAAATSFLSELTQGPIQKNGGVLRVLALEIEVPLTTEG